jgi:2-keto-4-pentenoate hydratase/2-oxohepta-3-ene-1,7-dioic acid hydratase in catechol pathway
MASHWDSVADFQRGNLPYVKLCRFELKASPGEIRSGMVYSGKIYETDGAESIAVYEADQVRPLTPIARPSSLRFFRIQDGVLSRSVDDGLPTYFYGNPGAVYGPSQLIPCPATVAHLGFECYLAAIVGSDGLQIPIEAGDDFILGFSLLTVIVARDWLREDQAANRGPGRSFDIGASLGPVITTPDDLEEALIEETPARKYELSAVTRVNGVEVGRSEIQDLPGSIAELVSAASESGPIRSGDVLAFGPVAAPQEISFLSEGDDVQFTVEHLGTLSVKIG